MQNLQINAAKMTVQQHVDVTIYTIEYNNKKPLSHHVR